MDVNQLVQVHVKIREARRELTQKFQDEERALKEKEKTLENYMLKVLLDMGVESVRTEAGTFYRSEEMFPSCSDWGAFYQFIDKEKAFDALEKRVTKKFIVAYMEANEDKVPPGISIHREYVAHVRRPS
jgi:hypothetical protein